MRRSLMNCQMIRVISSPSSSTTGPTTLILDMRVTPALEGLGSRARLLDIKRLGHRGGPGPGTAHGVVRHTARARDAPGRAPYSCRWRVTIRFVSSRADPGPSRRLPREQDT